MHLTEAIFSRQSVRSYTDRKVDEATLTLLLRAAVRSPSAMNAQPWRFSIVQDVDMLRRLSDQAKSMLLATAATDEKAKQYAGMLRDPKFNIFYNGNTLVVISVEQKAKYSEADCWLAAATLMLAAFGAGLGTCCIGFAVPVLNTPEVKAELGLGPSAAVIAPILLGYPSAWPPPVPREEPRIVKWYPPRST